MRFKKDDDKVSCLAVFDFQFFEDEAIEEKKQLSLQEEKTQLSLQEEK
jgi:hypothetical protein